MDSGSYDAWLALGMVYYNDYQNEAALEALDKAQLIKPTATVQKLLEELDPSRKPQPTPQPTAVPTPCR